MRYESEKTERGNVGVSYISQADADKQAADMDAANCIDCTRCTDCTDCTNCTDCTKCTKCTDCTDCTDCTGVLKWEGAAVENLIAINGLRWPVAISKDQMQIGCQCHTIDDWHSFTDEQIAKMDSDALEFWQAHRVQLLSVCDSLKR